MERNYVETQVHWCKYVQSGSYFFTYLRRVLWKYLEWNTPTKYIKILSMKLSHVESSYNLAYDPKDPRNSGTGPWDFSRPADAHSEWPWNPPHQQQSFSMARQSGRIRSMPIAKESHPEVIFLHAVSVWHKSSNIVIPIQNWGGPKNWGYHNSCFMGKLYQNGWQLGVPRHDSGWLRKPPYGFTIVYGHSY